MAYAYTPGLKVSESCRIVRKRILPLKGKVVVREGEEVSPEKVVAETFLPGRVQMINLAHSLGIAPRETTEVLLVKEGDRVEKDELLAEKRSFLRVFKSFCRSPITGILESVSTVSGQLILREPPIPVSIRAYIQGRIKRTFPEEGVEVETVGTFIQGIFGIGGETWGPLEVLASSPEDILQPSQIREGHKGKILVGGSSTFFETLDRARSVGVCALVIGGIHDTDLKRLLGYDIGVAITGAEDLGLTLIITEGFGRINMAERTFHLLKKNEGQFASVSGATQIRAGVLRPEIVIPNPEAAIAEERGKQSVLGVGSLVRIIRGPHFGSICRVKSLPPQLIKIETEAEVRIAEVEFPDGKCLPLPRANIEVLEV